MKLVLGASMQRACPALFVALHPKCRTEWPAGPLCQTEEHSILECKWKILKWKSINGILRPRMKLLSENCLWTWNGSSSYSVYFGRSWYTSLSVFFPWSKDAHSTYSRSHVAFNLDMLDFSFFWCGAKKWRGL